ncbi:hypothetical protein J1605_009516 [Eschrichtius robustus]|uniref:Uncharacterized protein n=1 Tax=Eschrichtius robustus TaxID=9764 RepID=A0AB34GUF5_ESCRO|nr:hypothetical protein J1605_009516 [Eschrichtius robustus]
MWDLPGPGLEPVSPALVGGFLTTVLPGKSLCRSCLLTQQGETKFQRPCPLHLSAPESHLLRGMWDLPGPGFEPVSPALADGFLTTVPAGKPPE